MRDRCIRLWNLIREWWWAFPLVAVWWVVMRVARVQAAMLKVTMRCSEWLAVGVNGDAEGDESDA